MSALRESLDEYLAVRRALGCKLVTAGRLLQKFVAFAEQNHASSITTDLALRWAMLPTSAQPAQWTNRLGMVRRFAQYLSGADSRTEIPPVGLLPHRFHRKPPHIYTEDEVARLLGAAQHLPSPTGLRAWTYSTFFGLLAVTGMRMSEPIALDGEHVDLVRGFLTIRKTKFGKSRLVPLHPTTQDALRRYAQLRDRIHPQSKTAAFFVSERGRRLTNCTVRWTFVKLSRQIGIRGPHDSHGPRLHDLRHGSAIETLLEWYRAGVDVEQHLPELATYLGHRHVTDTYWYLSATPELLRLAMARVDRKGGASA